MAKKKSGDTDARSLEKQNRSVEARCSIIIPALRKMRSIEDRISFLNDIKNNGFLSEYDRSIIRRVLPHYIERKARREGDYEGLVRSLRVRGESEQAHYYLPKIARDGALSLSQNVCIDAGYYEEAEKYTDLMASKALERARKYISALPPHIIRALSKSGEGISESESDRRAIDDMVRSKPGHRAIYDMIDAIALRPDLYKQLNPDEQEFCDYALNYDKDHYRGINRHSGPSRKGIEGSRNRIDFSRFIKKLERSKDEYQQTPGWKDYIAEERRIQEGAYRVPERVKFQPHNSFDNIKSQRNKTSRRVGATMAIVGLGASVFFIGSNLTGNVIGSLSSGTTNWIGICAFLVGVAGAMLCFKSKK